MLIERDIDGDDRAGHGIVTLTRWRAMDGMYSVRLWLLEVADNGFYRDLGITMLETIVGFVCGAIIGVACAIGLGASSYARKMIEPYIIAIGGTPKIIFLPIIFLIFGLGME